LRDELLGIARHEHPVELDVRQLLIASLISKRPDIRTYPASGGVAERHFVDGNAESRCEHGVACTERLQVAAGLHSATSTDHSIEKSSGTAPGFTNVSGWSSIRIIRSAWRAASWSSGNTRVSAQSFGSGRPCMDIS
jgi:hypothetical protein